MNLFQIGNFALHGGEYSDWKIECDALTDEDWETLAYLIQDKVTFYGVIGVPKGGIKLARALRKYGTLDNSLPILIVDDVLTTGASMQAMKDHVADIPAKYVLGYVVFARRKCPNWVSALFQMEG